MGKNYAYRLVMEADRLPDALAALGKLAAPEPLGPTVVRIPGREFKLPFSSNFGTGAVDFVPGRDNAAFEAALWFGLDQALEDFLAEESDALELARVEGGTGIGYVYVYAHPTAELEEPLSELTLVAASSSISELFHQSETFRTRLIALLEHVGARAGLLLKAIYISFSGWRASDSLSLSPCLMTTGVFASSARPLIASTVCSCPCQPLSAVI